MRKLLMLWRVGRSDLGLLWFALRHPDRPTWLLPASLVIALFAFQPLNFAVPFVGAIDDLVLLPLLLHGMLKLLPEHLTTSFVRRRRSA